MKSFVEFKLASYGVENSPWNFKITGCRWRNTLPSGFQSHKKVALKSLEHL